MATCHVGCPSLYCLHEKLKKTNEARIRKLDFIFIGLKDDCLSCMPPSRYVGEKEQFDDSLSLRQKQINKLKTQCVDAQTLVHEYSGLTEKLTAELDR